MLSYNALAFLCVFMACVGAACWLFKKDTEKENRRKAAMKMAGMFRSKGLKYVPELLEDYAVGDYSGMAKIIDHAAHALADPADAERIFDQMVDNVIAARKAGTTVDAALAAAKKAVEDATALVAKDS